MDFFSVSTLTGQVLQAFPRDTAPRFLLRDRDRIYGDAFARQVRSMGIRQVLTAYNRKRPMVGGLHHRQFREAA